MQQVILLFNPLPLGRRIAVLPLLAGAGFVMVLVMVVVAGRGAQQQLAEVQQGLMPAGER